MPEGDTIFRTARTLARALAGNCVERFEAAFAPLSVAAENAQLVGRELLDVTAHGKHVLMQFSGELCLRTHMRMSGSWHIYRVGERWQRPRSQMRLWLQAGSFEAVAFLVHEAELIGMRELDQVLQRLGPDVLAEGFDSVQAAERVLAGAARPICDVLLDQRVLAGIGNVYKSELLFLARVHPLRAAGTLDSACARELTARAQKLLRANVGAAHGGGIVTYTGLRRTTGRASPGDRLWVYDRGGQPCRECGTPITMQRMGEHARSTYFCPQCQPLQPAARAFGA
jgi:endonuclease-8